MHLAYAIRAVSDLDKVTFACYRDGKLVDDQKGDLEDMKQRDALPRIHDLFKDLMHRAADQAFPVIYMDECSLFWCCIREEDSDTYAIGGPMTTTPLNVIERNQAYHLYGMKDEDKDEIPRITFNALLAMLRALQLMINGREAEDGEMIYGNGLTKDTFNDMKEDQIRFDLKMEDLEQYHHSWQEERMLQEFISAGNVGRAYEQNAHLMDTAGYMGADIRTHWYNLGIAGITLSTRSAIAGGMSPAQAYQLSDYYINQLHMGDSVVEIQKIVSSAVVDMTQRVENLRKKQHYSYVEQCKDYVSAHYREKIYIADIAEALGISEGYLSRMFRKEEGVTFQTYVLHYRLDRAANLLKYSDRTVGEISAYMNFPTQSYFGEQFRKYKQMSPGEFRQRYKPTEFVE